MPRRLIQSAGFEVGLHVRTPAATDCTRPAPIWTSIYSSELNSFANSYPSLPAPATQPHALHRLERLGDPAEGRAGQRHPARHELLLLAAGLGPEPARHVHRLGHADALRRPRRHHDRRLPGDHADDRRVGAELPVHDRRPCSTTPSAPRGTTASSPPTCTPTRATAAPMRSSPRPRPAACRWSPPARC